MGSLCRMVGAGLLISLSSVALAQRADVAGSADHPLVGRYEGAKITYYQTKAYEELSLPWKVQERSDRQEEAWQSTVAGKLVSIRYEGPAGRSILEVMRNYEAALKAKGFEIEFVCTSGRQCAPGRSAASFWDAGRGGIGLPTTWDTSVYLLAEKPAESGKVTVALLGVETQGGNAKMPIPHVAATIIEGRPMETDKIRVIGAAEMEQTIARDGRIAIHGILFDIDKADIKPESATQIEQLAALLKRSPDLEILIVGHTDATGAYEHNLSLSARRAKAVLDALASRHGVESRRLTAAGAGMMAPVASNRSEEGRARNRRVEIVERIAN